MDLYMAGSTFSGLNEWIQDNSYNKLMSQLNDSSSVKSWKEHLDIMDKKCNSKLFIDSGAFTAWTKGTKINVDEYIDWLNARSEFITLFGQVDCIPGSINYGATKQQVEDAAQETWANYLYMRKKVKNVDGLLYTFHVGEPYKYLKQALEWTDENGKHIPYIALGGMVGKPLPVKTHFLDDCFDIIKNSSNPDVKVHAFGMTSLSILKKYKITSADSTSWIMTAVTGSVFSPYGTICLSTETQDKPNNLVNLEPTKQEAIKKYISNRGFNIEKLQSDYKQRELFNIMYLQEWAQNYVYEQPKVKTTRLF